MIVMCGYGHAAVSTDLLISGDGAVAAKPAGFDSQYMQDLTPQECESKVSGTTSQLIDKRDGKKYWVTKIGSRCMMTQDLRLDLSADTELTSELSDINYSSTANYEEEEKNGQVIYKWNTNSKYPPVDTYTWLANTGSSYTTTRSWNLGEYVMVNAAQVTGCSYRSGPAGCPDQVFNVGEVWETDENEQDVKVRDAFAPTLNYENVMETYNEETMEYDAHFLLGNYYQFMAVTAGSAVKAANRAAPSSICPRGWQLPVINPDNGLRDPLEEYAGTTIAADLKAYIEGMPFYATYGGIIQSATLISLGAAGNFLTNSYRTSVYIAILPTNTAFTIQASQAHFAYQARCVLREEEE